MGNTSMVSSQQIQVRELQSGDEARWDAFVESCESGTFFHLSGWKKIIEKTLHHKTIYLFCEKDGEILAVLPLAHVKSYLFGNALISLPFLVYGGVVAVDENAGQLLVDAACDRARNLGVDHLELRGKSPSGNSWPSKESYVTFSRTLDPDSEKNLLAIPRKQRAMIRKGIKFGLTAEVDSDPGRLYEALLPCKRNLGTPFFNRSYLQSICETFGDKAEILTVTRNNNTICSVMSFRFRSEILPYYGGGGEAARTLKGNDFMYWAVMEKACQDGVKIFDFGRSMVGSGAFRFKKHWGFEPTPLAYEYFLIGNDEMPNLNPTNPKYKLLIEAWKRLPLSVAGWLGPMIARRLG